MIKVLFRKSLAEENEYEIASKYFKVIESRSLVEPHDFIIPRYSALPYFEELDIDTRLMGGHLINNWKEHRFIADIQNWYSIVEEFTPRTWFRLEDIDIDGPFILKGETNSRKSLWKTHMYADNRKELMHTYFNLQDDSLIGSQTICIREYEPFTSYGEGIGGIPITEEYRFFCYKDQVLASGYYWSNHPEIQAQNLFCPSRVPKSFLKELMERVSLYINFYVLDIAHRDDGEWRLVEINDGCMSGLSCVDPDKLYKNLKKAIDDR